MGNESYLQKLSENQYLAIKQKGNVLLTAIPGSGKTRTLTNKILYEYSEKEYKKIVAITYTNRASEEMIERIINQLGIIPDNIWIGTIHKFCLEFILRKFSSHSEYLSKPFSILGEDDDEKLLDELKKKYNIGIYSKIDYSLSVYGVPNEKKYFDFVNEYYTIQRESRKINFNLILFESFKLLYENPNICINLSSMIRYLCVDEYQDTQELQYQIISLIYKSSKRFNMFFVGDPNQAIYTGLGGVVKSKDELEKNFETDFEELVLDECYRSSQEIIDFYKQFSLAKVEMKSATTKYENSTIIIDGTVQKNNLIDKICEIINENLEIGIPENEICIVAPQWFFLYDISTKIKQKLPDVKFDAPNIIPLKRDEENICYKLSKIILTKYTFYNKNRILHIMKEIKKQLNDEYSINLQYTPIELLKILFSCETNDLIGTEYLKNSLINFFTKINLYEFFSKNITEYINMTLERIKLCEKYGIEDSRLSFEKSLRSKEGIVVSTIHGVKGDEFRVVIAFGLLEGYVPHWNSILDTGTAREDSKKLLFVLCSRAKEKLYLFAENDRTTKKGDLYVMNKDLIQAIVDNKKFDDLN
mgnify:CR=1 FL=1